MGRDSGRLPRARSVLPPMLVAMPSSREELGGSGAWSSRLTPPGREIETGSGYSWRATGSTCGSAAPGVATSGGRRVGEHPGEWCSRRSGSGRLVAVDVRPGEPVSRPERDACLLSESGPGHAFPLVERREQPPQPLPRRVPIGVGETDGLNQFVVAQLVGRTGEQARELGELVRIHTPSVCRASFRVLESRMDEECHSSDG